VARYDARYLRLEVVMLRNIGSFIAAYRKSMKGRGMDGPIDLLFYRPVGFLIAWVFSFTGVSPNAVTLCGVSLGLAAALAALPGTYSAFILCALLFQAANCLDCADGQLARLTGRYSKEGRILDGLADYAVNIFVLAGITLGLLRAGHDPVQTIFIVFIAGAATAISSMYYDRVKVRFADFMACKAENEPDELRLAIERASGSRGSRRILWRIYALYLRAQSEQGEDRAVRAAGLSADAKAAYAKAMYPLLAAWSFAGSSAQVLYFLIFAAIGRVEMYFAACVAIALITAAFLILQQVIELRFKSKYYAED
jgi:hypothetical protein